MYGVPPELNLDVMVGSESTQIRVGQYDIQFAFGDIDFRVQSRIVLLKSGVEFGAWEEGKWPDDSFYEIMNTPVASVCTQSSKIILINLDNGISIKLCDDSEKIETMQIVIGGGEPWII